MELKEKALITFNKDGQDYSIRISEHGALRANQRDISEDIIISCIFALTLERLEKCKQEGKDLAIIDENNNVAIIVTMYRNTIMIVTVIDKANIYVKNGTDIKRI